MSTPEKKFTLLRVVKDVSKLPNYQIYQTTDTKRFNIPWGIRFYRENNTFVTDLMCCQPRTNHIWTVVTNATCRLTLTNGSSNSLEFQFTASNDSQLSYYSTGVLIPYSEDDSLVIEIEVTIESMTGIEKPEKIRNFGVEAKEFSDVVLRVKGEDFYVSRMYLAAQSTYFHSLFMKKFKEAEKKIVKLKDIDPDDFQIFLELLYVDKTLTDTNIESVLKLVDMYDAKNAARLCEQYLMFESTHSLRTKLKIAVQYKFEDLKTHCLDRIKSRTDIRAIKGRNFENPDESMRLDPSIADELFELSLSLTD